MVHIIEDRLEAHGADYLVFKVYQDPDTQEVMGYLIPRSTYDDGVLVSVGTPHGVKAADALPDAIEGVKKLGLEYLWIQDLDGLFPPDKRPHLPDLDMAA